VPSPSCLSAFWCGFASAASLTADGRAPKSARPRLSVAHRVCELREHSKGQPTFLNLDKAYPNQTFTAVIWGSDRSKFGTLESALLGKQVCATGVIQLFRDGQR